MARAWNKPFAFILNQTPIRGQRLTTAANALGEEAALDISGVVATPFIVMRNDHQDALSAGLAVSEYAPASKSAEEIRGLWQWVEAKLNAGATIQDAPFIAELPEVPLATMLIETPAEAAAFVA